jgi:catalase
VVVPNGQDAARELDSLGQALEFLKDQYRHAKPILMLGAGAKVAEKAGVLAGRDDWAIVRDVRSFIKAVGRHRNWDRAQDPPRV